MPEIITNYGSFIAHHGNPNFELLQDYYKLWQFHYKLRQWVITNYAALLQIATTKSYYKLRQLLFLKNSKLLQITSSLITYYCSF